MPKHFYDFQQGFSSLTILIITVLVFVIIWELSIFIHNFETQGRPIQTTPGNNGTSPANEDCPTGINCDDDGSGFRSGGL